jgi:hypothetical protein
VLSGFSYDLKDMYAKNDAGVICLTPFGNNLLAEFAMKVEKRN